MLKDCRISGFADEIDENFSVQLEVMGQLGQRYVELRAADGINVADMTVEKARECMERMREKGIKVSALGSPIGKIKITDDFAPHFEKFCHVVELAGIFETPYIRMFSFYLPSEADPERYREDVFQRISRMVEYAKEHQVVLLHENEKGIYGDSGERCLKLMEAFYGDHFKCTFDFANFVQCREDTLACFEKLKPYIAYIHVKDALMETGEVVPAGEGDGHLEEILRQLDQEGYRGFLSLEPHLSNFAGLALLEADPLRRKEQDGIRAYRLAYQSLTDLLNK